MTKIVITCGDPAGIGPEVVLKALLNVGAKREFNALIIGSDTIFNDNYYHDIIDRLNHEFLGELEWESCEHSTHGEVIKKRPNADNGRLVFKIIKRAVECMGQADGLVTAPLCKASFRAANIPFMGHTDLLQHLTNSEHVTMGFVTPSFSVALATIHIPLSEVSIQLNEPQLEQTIRHAMQLSSSSGSSYPKVAVCGLNPHAGEDGLLGNEEEEWIRPLIKRLKYEYPGLEGPFPPDTVFIQAKDKVFDTIVALYHDQGLIPVKMLHFDEAVNVSLGLPFIRSSPDHGTAFDIAFTNSASSLSTEHAIQFVLNTKS